MNYRMDIRVHVARCGGVTVDGRQCCPRLRRITGVFILLADDAGSATGDGDTR